MQSSEQSEQCVDLAKFPPQPQKQRHEQSRKAKQILANFPYGETYSKNSCSFWQGGCHHFWKVIIFSAICSVNFWAQTLINLPFKATALFPVNLCSKFELVKREPPPAMHKRISVFSFIFLFRTYPQMEGGTSGGPKIFVEFCQPFFFVQTTSIPRFTGYGQF